MLSRSFAIALGVTTLIAVMAGGAASASPDAPADRVLPTSEHTSPKAQSLASKHASALRDLNFDVYHCLPWVEVAKHSIGFFKPRGAPDDKRFLSIRVYIEQDPSPQFANLTFEDRAAAMFSRYVGPLLRRMNRSPGVMNDDAIDGFTVVLEWLKRMPARGTRPVHETIAVFVDKVDADEYLVGRAGSRELATRGHVLAWDGETPRGALKLAAWDDDFVSTFKVKNYQVPSGVTCH
ncbi:MAG: hypothetical protein HYU51_05480 [Candidatus Rokubacteria bacterium]|nr:hypothetical protein [Candidatus Rokubacteria bacterium]